MTDNDLGKEISFTFGVNELQIPDPSRPYYMPEFAVGDVNLEVAITRVSEPTVSANEKTQISSLKLNFNDGTMRYVMHLNNLGEVVELTLNDENILDFFAEFQMVLTQGTIFPELLLRPRQQPSPARLYYQHQGSLLGANWVEELFNYRIEIKPSSGHLSINLIEGSHSTNIVDTGYGVSQILPVLGQIWWAANRPQPAASFSRSTRAAPRQRNSSILAIEQPELHLHPAHQALLADAFAAQSTQKRGELISFLIETHSETLVNRLGELIAQGKLQPASVQILIFEPSKNDDRVTEVSVAYFGDKGELLNWPYGFFQPSAPA